MRNYHAYNIHITNFLNAKCLFSYLFWSLTPSVRLQSKNGILSCLDGSEGNCTGTGSGQTELRWRCGECEFTFSLNSSETKHHLLLKFEKQNSTGLKSITLNTALQFISRS